MKKEKNKNIVNVFLLISITILVLYFTLKDNFKEVIGDIASANIWWIIVALLFYLGYVLLKAVALYKIVKEFKADYPFKKALKLSLSTQFFNAITPFAGGGEPFQIYSLTKDGLDIPKSSNVVIQNFIVYQIALVVLGILAIIFNYTFHMFKAVTFLKQLVTIGFLMNTIVIVFLFVVTFSDKFNKQVSHFIIWILNKMKVVKNKEKTYKKWEDYLTDFGTGARTIVKNKKLFAETILLNFAGLCSMYIVPLAISCSLGYPHAFNGFTAIVASAYVMLIGAFVPIPGGTGGLEYSFIQFYGNFLAPSPLHAAMIIWRACTYYFGMIIGAIAVNIKLKDSGK